MPSKAERDYYSKGFEDGIAFAEGRSSDPKTLDLRRSREYAVKRPSPKRKLSAWNKFVKANSKKKIYQYASGKLKLKKMGIAFRKKRK